MSYEQVRKDVQEFFSENFTGVEAEKIAWDNVSFTPVNGEAWVRVSLQHNISNMVSVGGPNVKIRRFGILFVQVFVPEGNGTALAEQIADNVATTLEAKQMDTGLTFQETTKREVGVGAGWYQVNVSTPFYYDDNRAVS